ncbi:MAG: PEGA domain-containing protein [Victivallales bacterium]|nr:PEGA domain-containing protein [Victivallales bacterium]
MANVNFTCNIQGADVKVDGVAYGTIPALVTLPKGVHNLRVEYPFCVPYVAKAFFTDGQTYNVVLQLDATGRERFKSEALFAETIDRIRKTGETDDYVRRKLADGTAEYWKNSSVNIKDGKAETLELNPPGGNEPVAPKAPTVDQLMEKAKGL